MVFSKIFSVLAFFLCFSLSFSKNVQFEIDVTWGVGAPDGNQRYMIFTNGQFPGPLLNVSQGDQVLVRKFVVNNHLPTETSIHFHGIEQQGTPWSDGVPGVNQKPIPSNGTFTYRWTASQYGTYWYHGHARGQIQDGLFGPILIQPAQNQPSPFHLVSNDALDLAAMTRAEANATPVILSDWIRLTSEELYTAEEESNVDIYCMDSFLINGKGSVNCQPHELLVNQTLAPVQHLLGNDTVTDKGCTPPNSQDLTLGDFTTDHSKVPAGVFSGCKATNNSMEVIHVDAAQGWASLNFIGAMSIKTPVVSIDNHSMWVYAVDGSYIEPQPADSIFLYSGERYSAMVKLDKAPGDYTIRVANQNADQLISGFATLSYKDGSKNVTSTPSITYGGMNITADVVPLDETLLVPYPASAPASSADSTHMMGLGRLGANFLWTLNGNVTYGQTSDDDTPLLFNPNSTDGLNPNRTIRTNNGTWVDIILQVHLDAAAPAQPAHPVHKHSGKAYIIGKGAGVFNYTSIADALDIIPQNFNLQNPQLRDSFTTPAVLQAPAWVVFRYQSINPGAWFVHCHVQTHLSGGMAMTILDGVDAWPTIPEEYRI